MRRAALFCVFLSILFLLSACTLPFGLKMTQDDEPSAEEHTFVITTEHHEGSQKLTDKVEWYANTIAALHYLGSRSGLDQSLKTLRKKSFDDMKDSDLLDLKRVDLGGSDAFLVIPRFDQETLSVFTIAIDSQGEAHILNQAADNTTPFILLCNATDSPNAQLGVTLVDVPGRFRTIVRRDPDSGDLQCDAAFQPMRLAS